MKRVRTSVLLCACVASGLSGCAIKDVPDDESAVYISSLAEVALPVRSLQSRKFLTVVRQRYDFSCGSAALATLLRYHYGDAQTEESVFQGMWSEGDRPQIRRAGFSLLDMKRYLARRAIGSDGYGVSVPDIVRAGIPGIVLLNVEGYRHFVVLKGIDSGTVILGDPSVGLRRLSL